MEAMTLLIVVCRVLPSGGFVTVGCVGSVKVGILLMSFVMIRVLSMCV